MLIFECFGCKAEHDEGDDDVESHVSDENEDSRVTGQFEVETGDGIRNKFTTLKLIPHEELKDVTDGRKELDPDCPGHVRCGVGSESGEEKEGKEEKRGDFQGKGFVGDDSANHKTKHGRVASDDNGASDWLSYWQRSSGWGKD